MFKKLDSDSEAHKEVLRVALLADAATQQLASLLKVLFSKQGIRANIYEGPFDAIELQAYDANSELYSFKPDVVVILNAVQALRSRYYCRGSSGDEFLDAE